MIRLHNLRHLKTFRKSLRNDSTVAESCLWLLLKGRQLEGRKFRRQHSVGSYILDFYCPEENLAIELDGAVHDDPFRAEYDHQRTRYLSTRGIRVVRIENQILFDRPEDTMAYIASFFSSDATQDNTP